MADNKEKLITTIVKQEVIFGKDNDHRKLTMGFFQKTLFFSIYRTDKSDGKFKQKADMSVFLDNLWYNETPLYLMAKEMVDRLDRMHKGEKLESNGMVVFNKQDLDSSTYQIAMDAYMKDDREVVLIQLGKKPKDGKEWVYDKFYFTRTKEVMCKDKRVNFSKGYIYFYSLWKTLETFVNKTSSIKATHMFKLTEEEKKAKDNKPNNSSSQDDDDYPF